MRSPERWPVSAAAWLLFLFCTSPLFAGVRVLYQVEAAEEISQKTGKPILAIAGTTDCVYCRKMAAELENNDQLEALASQYVVLKMDTAGSEFPGWSARYECESGGVPKVYVVRADGKQLLGKPGAPQDMDNFLKRYLEDAGKILEPKELADLEKAAKNAQKAIKRKAWADAIEIVAAESGKGSYAEAAVTLEKLAGELVEKGKLALKDAEKKLASKDQFDGALALVEGQRQFEGLAATKELFDAALAKHNDDAEIAGLISQAELFASARKLEAQRKWPEAIEAFQELSAKHPDSPGAAQAAKHIADLEKRISVASGKSASARKGPESAAAPAGADEKRALSFLKMARQFEKKDPAKAREYCEKAAKAAPDSDAAKEAAELLKSLPK
jgi:hypothetical protein